MITAKYLHENYLYKDGHLYHKVKGPHRAVGTRVGYVDDKGYTKVKIAGVTYPEHKLIYLMFKGETPTILDHIDNNPSNNRIENLRPATISQNNQNTRVRKDNKSGVKGVNWCAITGSWRARVQVDGLRINLGTFETIADAEIAISRQREKLHGEFCRHR